MIYIYIEKDKFYNQVKYVVDTIANCLGIEYLLYNNDNLSERDILINYSNKVFEGFKKVINIKPSNKLFSENYLKKESLPIKGEYYNLDFNEYGVENIISIYSADKELYINKKENLIETNIDFISNIFFMLSRYEEVLITERDRHNRFKAEDCFAYRNNCIQRPIVNEYIEVIWNFIKSLNPNIKRKNIWKDKDFGVLLSHDIDMISKYKSHILKKVGRNILKERNIAAFIDNIKKYAISKKNIEKDPYWKFDYMIGMEKKYGFSASYYFMAGGNSSYDNFYSIKDKSLKNVFENIVNAGSEIGLHGSYNSYDSYEFLSKEKNRLSTSSNKEIKGIRQHYLRFEASKTWAIQEKAGYLYDSTLGFAEVCGFRAGICYPFKPYDLIANRELNMWEIPLVIMDGTLCDKQYLNLDTEKGKEKVMEMVRAIKKYNGVFSLLWHNSSLDEESVWEKWIPVYEDILEFLYNENALVLSGDKIIEKYNQ